MSFIWKPNFNEIISRKVIDEVDGVLPLQYLTFNGNGQKKKLDKTK